jgi:molecular chaperone GrpE
VTILAAVVTEEPTKDESDSAESAESAPPQSSQPETPEPVDPDDAGEEEAAPDPLQEALAELQKTRDQLLRTAADFDNFRKRSRRELIDAEQRGRDELLKELLPVFDNLERAQEHAAGASDVAALSDGIQLVLKQFLDTLGRLGIEQVQAAGQAFDPTLHEAIQQLETADVPAGTVANQVQAGYKMGDRLLRPAMVVVAKSPAGAD